MTEISDKDVAMWLRQKTACGLGDAKGALDKLVFAMQHHPPIIMDNPYVLEMTWKKKYNEEKKEIY